MKRLNKITARFAFGIALLSAAATSASEVSKVEVADGKHITCHLSHALFQPNPEVRHAVVVIHGVLRNSAPYFERMASAVALSGLTRETIVLAPGIRIKEDAADDEYFWSAGGWSKGDIAFNGRDKTKISSFDAVDRLLAILADKTNFPALKTVAVIGHSAGGQFVNRYASAAILPDGSEIDFRFIILNPSSYMYPDDRRLHEGNLVGAELLSSSFPNYNDYRYGTEKLNSAMRRVGVERIREQLFTRRCYYFAGSNDVKISMLDTQPGAMVQGQHRFARFCSYRDFVVAHEDARWWKNSQFMSVEGVNHDSKQMFGSEQVRHALFCETAQLPKPWNEVGMKKSREFSKTLDTAAVVIIQHGEVVDQWGAVAMPINCHSIRKSILSALYGLHVEKGTINLDATLQQLGIDDNEPSLTEVERSATVRDLLKARSGVYHPALYETAGMKAKRPKRGSHPPGAFWYYNNWDFNASCTVFENLTARSIFEDFELQFAKPLGMRDFRRGRDGVYVTGANSVHPAYPFYLSARDLAKLGQLMLQRGAWDGKQLIPEAWVIESTKSYSDAGESGGYGYMWWIAVDGRLFPGVSLPEGSYAARGNRGQYLVVIPEWDMVVCHRVDSSRQGTAVSKTEFGKLLAMIVAARPQGNQ